MFINIALEEVIIKVINVGVKLQYLKSIGLVAYADDILILSKTKGDFQTMAETFIEESK